MRKNQRKCGSQLNRPWREININNCYSSCFNWHGGYDPDLYGQTSIFVYLNLQKTCHLLSLFFTCVVEVHPRMHETGTASATLTSHCEKCRLVCSDSPVMLLQNYFNTFDLWLESWTKNTGNHCLRIRQQTNLLPSWYIFFLTTSTKNHRATAPPAASCRDGWNPQKVSREIAH